MKQKLSDLIHKFFEGLSWKMFGYILLGAAICTFGVHNIHQRCEITEMCIRDRYSTDQMVYELEALLDSGVDMVMLFGIPAKKDEVGSQAFAPDGIVQKGLVARADLIASAKSEKTLDKDVYKRQGTDRAWKNPPDQSAHGFRRPSPGG